MLLSFVAFLVNDCLYGSNTFAPERPPGT